LAALRLSERVKARGVDSLPPATGNVYSLMLSNIPDAELTAARVPVIKPPSLVSDDFLYVPVIPAIEEELPPDSIDTGNVSFGSPLSANRLDVTKRDFGNIPLLSDMPPDVLRQLITDVAMVELETGQVLFSEDDLADAMYVVVEGSVTAVTLPHRDKPIQLAHLFEGEFFGEIGLMSDQPRGATVSAHEPTRLLRFDRDIVAVLIEQDPGFLATLLQFLKDRLVEDLMMSSPLFAPFNEQERYDLAELFEFLEIEPNSILLESGQHPIGMYVLLTGEATMKGASAAGTVRKLSSGDIFGEQALLSNEVSQVEVRTTTKSFALCLPSDAFPEVVMTHPTVLAYLSALSEGSKGELDVSEDFLDHIRFF
jgi:CRP-like cAMP-binding protein